MTITTVQISVPGSVLAAVRKAPHEVGAELRLAAGIPWYQQGVISMERAAEVADLDRGAFLAELARRHIDVFTVDPHDLALELRGA